MNLLRFKAKLAKEPRKAPPRGPDASHSKRLGNWYANLSLVFFSALVMLLIGGCATLPGHYVSVSDMRSRPLDEVLGRIGDERVIFVGEGHGSPEDHLVELEVVKRLREKGKDLVIALEMFPSDRQKALDRWNSGGMSEADFKKAYESSWTVPYGYYSDIFEYARRTGIPLAGINGNRDLINAAAKTGIGKLPAELRKSIKVPSCEGAPEYSRMTGIIGSKAGHVSEMPFFCDGQLLRDGLMAYNIAGLARKRGVTVIALVGSVHALKTAVPGILLKYYDLKSTVIVSKDFVDLLSPEAAAGLADYIWY